MNTIEAGKGKREVVDLFQYTNYRLFLKASYEYMKENNRAFSYRFFSQQAGFKSPNYLKLVIDGTRNLSADSLEKFIDFFKFKEKEAEYFRLLVAFNQEKNSEQKNKLAQEILRLSTFKRLHPLTQDHFEYFSKWYYVAIRELLATKHLKLDSKSISKLLFPQVSEKEVDHALDVLERLQLIKRYQNRYIQTEELVTTGDEVSSSAVVTYHRNMLSLAGESIDTIDRELRDISAVTVGLSQDNIRELKTLIQKFRKNVMELSEQDKEKEAVYQVGIQMFPLSKVGGQ